MVQDCIIASLVVDITLILFISDVIRLCPVELNELYKPSFVQKNLVISL